MSSEQIADITSQITERKSQNTTDTSTTTTYPQSSTGSTQQYASILAQRSILTDESEDQKQPAKQKDQTSETTSPSTPDDPRVRPRQVIAVSASKGPAAFFNLARKFLVTDDICDLSALEGAIVSAADAAHLLERSKLAKIIRIQTSYVTVEPKRRKQDADSADTAAVDEASSAVDAPSAEFGQDRPSSGRELRRARIVITVQRTESYRQWLIDNPLQSAGTGDEEEIDLDEVVTSSAEQEP